MTITEIAANEVPDQDLSTGTPGLSHLRVLELLDRTGLSAWLLGFGGFIVLTVTGFSMLIVFQVPDPRMYSSTVAFCAIVAFLIVFYFSMGRGWHRDVVILIEFDRELQTAFDVLEPSRRVVVIESIFAVVCAFVNLQISGIKLDYSVFYALGISSFYVLQYLMIILSIDVILRQLISLMTITQKIRIDLLSAEIYSTLANSMVRHVGLYIFGVCIIALSYITFTAGALGPSEMLVAMMPWYLPGLIIISLYLIPYNHFHRRMHSRKFQELNSISSALAGNQAALGHTLLKDEPRPISKIDLLYYQDRIRAIREWPFTDRIRALVLFGILPPLTWVIAAIIEILIEGAI